MAYSVNLNAFSYGGYCALCPNGRRQGGSSNDPLVLSDIGTHIVRSFHDRRANPGKASYGFMRTGSGMGIVSGVMGLEMMGVAAAAFPDVIFPLVVWSLPAVTGYMNWNSN